MPKPIESMAEALGFPRDAKLLLVNSDDSGMSNSVNQAFLTTWEKGLVRATTAMVPCPWFPAFARLARERGIPAGVHLTCTSEWTDYRWGPVSRPEDVPSLLDETGRFHHDEFTFYQKAQAEDVAREFRAQIERFVAHGLEPTHLDSHMGVYHFNEAFFEIAYGLAKEYGCGIREAFPERVARLHREGFPCPDRLFYDTYEVEDEKRFDFYADLLKNLEPGLSELIVHCGADDSELREITEGQQRRRALDADFFRLDSTAKLIRDLGIRIIGYADLKKLIPRGRAAA